MMKNSKMQFRQTVCDLAGSLCLGALCHAGRMQCRAEDHPPTETAPAAFKESPTQFKEAEGWTVAQPQDAVLRGKWWEIYNEPELNALEEQLNINNQNIQQYFENFMEARALVREARAQYFPTVSVGGRLHQVADLLQRWVCGWFGPDGRKAVSVVLSAGRGFVGAGSLGEGAQYGACQPI